MGLFDILGDLAEVPFRVAQIPTKALRSLDEATVDSGVGELLDDANEATLGDMGRAIKGGLKEGDA